MKKNKLKELIEFIGLSYQKELLKIGLINIAILTTAVFVFMFSKSLVYLGLITAGLVVLDYYLLSRYSDLKKNVLKARENELITLISYFEVYIQNSNNVYQSFNLLIPYSSDWMKEKIETLLKEIDEDKSVQPFINFANNFTQLSTHSLMLSIYQMVDQGESYQQLLQFNSVFDALAKNRHQEINDQKEKQLSNMSIFPLIGAGLITITLTISILLILGELIYVI